MSTVLGTARLAMPWQTIDPFLFCVHHDDAYPKGNEKMGPDATLDGRSLGMDFEGKDGWRMYHGQVVPGFPRHPHRGFETVTVARRGFIDHSDSMGATARYGHGDLQWMTAGKGVVHAEMFPLVKRDADNPTELFQIWLNLPSVDKMCEPAFKMLWDDTIPEKAFTDANGKRIEVTVYAGTLDGATAPEPPPSSWAARADTGVAIWTLRLQPGAAWTIPEGPADAYRVLYFFDGDTLDVDGEVVKVGHAIQVMPGMPIQLTNGTAPTEILMLQGKPIAEPVAQRGPFVMNTQTEIQQAFADYRRTGFGGWPWERDDPVHAREEGRFAIHADGTVDRPKG